MRSLYKKNFFFLVIIFFVILFVACFYINSSQNICYHYKDVLVSNKKHLTKGYLTLSEIKDDIGVKPITILSSYKETLDDYKEKISFLRETKNFYYAVFESEKSVFYIFFDKKTLSMNSSFFLSNNEELRLLKTGQKFRDVCQIDSSAIISKHEANSFISLHVLPDGSQVIFEYFKNGDDYYIKEKYFNGISLESCVNEILPYDLPN